MTRRIEQLMREVDSNKTNYKLERERLKLAERLGVFAEEMAIRLDECVERGKGGWDNSKYDPNMHEMLLANAKVGDYVDVANLAMFLHNHGYKPGA